MLEALHECLNEHCFYVNHLFKVAEITVWTHRWNPDLQMLDLIPRCPSCNEVMEVYQDAEIQE